MRNMRSCWGWMPVLALMLISQTRTNEAATPSLFVSTELNSAYVYHGITYNNGAVFQPLVVVSVGDVGFYMWGNVDIGDYHGWLKPYEFSETDIGLSYSFSCPQWKTKGSFVFAQYLYPQITDSSTGKALEGTRELILKLEQPVLDGTRLAGLSLRSELYYDIQQVNDIYARMGLKYTDDIIKDKMMLEMNAVAGYSGRRIAPGLKSGMHDYEVSVAVSYKINSACSIGLKAGYTDTLDRDVLPEDRMDAKRYGGVNFVYSL